MIESNRKDFRGIRKAITKYRTTLEAKRGIIDIAENRSEIWGKLQKFGEN